jgi:murein DD-endopeptidase MepM/ murein hydrolase activator NlpD
LRYCLGAFILGLWLALLPHQAALAQSDARSYTVVSGDTLFEIAQRFGISVDELTAYNDITDPNLLAVGQVLLIPPAGAATTETITATASTTTTTLTTSTEPTAGLLAADLAIVRARPGDTVASIAARYGISAEQFSTLNTIDLNKELFPGQPFNIPRQAAGAEPLRFGAVRNVTIPPQLVQGRTGSVVVELAAPRQLSGDWNGLPLSFIQEPDKPNLYYAFLPVPALLAPQPYWLTIAYTATNGAPLSQSWPISVVEGPYETQHLELPDDVSGLLSNDVAGPEWITVTAAWSPRTPQLYWTNNFSRPVSSEYETTSPYGTRRTYYDGGALTYHEGQDFAVPAGVPVLATADGVVALAEPLHVRGNAVILNHGGGVYTGYWHLTEIKVVTGQKVKQGDVLGISGNTGLSTGAHVHWEMRIYGIAVDPLQFLDMSLVAPDESKYTNSPAPQQ